MQIREARIEDAAEACDVLRRSIVELCHADHRGDPFALEKWLANKTPENVASWIAHSHVLVAIEREAILGVGSVTSSGEITLNYVSPDARFRGISKALLRQLEARALGLGNDRCVLTSTETAHRLYRSAGYEDQGAPTVGFTGSPSYRMAKQLSDTPR